MITDETRFQKPIMYSINTPINTQYIHIHRQKKIPGHPIEHAIDTHQNHSQAKNAKTIKINNNPNRIKFLN